MRQRLPWIVGAIVLVAIAIWFFTRGGGSAKQPDGDKTIAKDDPWAKPAAPKLEPKQDTAPTSAPIFLRDADPVGALRLEGQVLDADDHPVGGAVVWLGSVPPRSTKTEDDGSFVFEKLVGRAYALQASKGDDVGGPITYTLTGASDPAVIRLRKGQTLTVIVTGAADGKAIAGATVEARSLADQRATTGADGKATLHAIAPGWIAVAVSAQGYATAHKADDVKAGQTELRVELARGAPVAGRVVDEAGKPIANARVIAREVSSLVPLDDADKDGALTDDKGAFTIAAVAAGSYRFVATDDDHAPGSSEPLTVDGSSPKDGVTITMKAAAVLAGHVITKDRRPAPYATIKVSPKELSAGGAEQWQASARQVVADDRGKFALHGLPRAQMRVRAESDTAASAIADVDLNAAPPKDLELVLDVSGTISGVVVDGDAQPVAEAQVTAMTDWMGGGGKIEDLAISGFSQATTDGGGRFQLHGLPDGAYRLWAQRAGGTTQPFEREGTAAKTGDTNVKIVLPLPGGIKGKVALENGGAVTSGTVSTGYQTSAAIVGGAFELGELAPGDYDVRVHGADFAETTKKDVKVEAGKTTDLGTITVHRGRRVTGRVVTAGGEPASGAKVAIGKLLISDGKSLGLGGAVSDEQMGMRTTIADRDGEFVLIGVGPDGGAILADDPARGRSDTLSIPPGTDDPPPITLALHGFGSIGGRVTLAHEPIASATVMVSPKSGDASIVVTTGADGTYLIEKIPEGRHHATVMRNAGLGASMTSTDTTVVAGQRTTLDIDIPQGDISLTIEIKGKDGAKVDAAEIYVGGGTVAIKNGKELQDAVLHGAGTGGGGVKVWLGGATFPTFDKMVAGQYSVCTLPITGNIADPRVARALQEQGEKLDVYCAPFTLKSDPKQQRFVHEVPAMKPLP